jgi:transposase
LLGAVGRRSGRLRVRLARRMWGAALVGFVVASTKPGAAVHTDDWGAYRGLTAAGRVHVPVSHAGPRTTWAQDLDGDGVREAHSNTIEGVWTGVRIFLAPFRGVSKWYLDQYMAVFEWGYNVKRATHEVLRAMLGIGPVTDHRT